MVCVKEYEGYWGLLFFLCLNECNAAGTYPGIEIWNVNFPKSHFNAIPMYILPSQSLVIVYLSSSSVFRCKACSIPEYFTTKLSTTKLKLIGP